MKLQKLAIPKIREQLESMSKSSLVDLALRQGETIAQLVEEVERVKRLLDKDSSDSSKLLSSDLIKRSEKPGSSEVLSKEYREENSVNQLEQKLEIEESAIAIIGMSGQFPGAPTIDEFWQNLKNGVESITHFSNEELISQGIDSAVLNQPSYVKANAFISDIELFDASFFNLNPKEAELIDPQHRLFLECAWSALENAGYDSEQYLGSIGVYAGAGMNTYLLKNVYPNCDRFDSAFLYQMMIGNEKDFLPTRVSYKLNLTGPSINIQTGCSTSLVGVHLACQSLINGECDMALAGGVSIKVPQKAGYFYQEGLIVSPNGHCCAFDANAKGTVGGDGVGIVVLKRLEDAIADRDNILAVIRGSAINNDGSSKIGYTAPSVKGQAAVIKEAQGIAGIKPETITYIETHGTGTVIGDPIEIAALTEAFGTNKTAFCAIGSLKTNIGHLGAAAGIASLIKTVLSLKYKYIPPSLNFEKPNPQIDFLNTPFYVNTRLAEWKTNGIPRRAGVSSFTIGGTNAHMILEEWDSAHPNLPPAQNAEIRKEEKITQINQLLLLSAKTPSALKKAAKNLATHLKQHPTIDLADVAYTLSIGRKAFNYRRILICSDIENAINNLNRIEARKFLSSYSETKTRPIVFLFPGQGIQYVNMGKELYQNLPTFRNQIDRCCSQLKSHLKLDLRDVLYPREENIEDAKEQIQQTAIAQTLLFIMEYALALLWIEWGIRPVALIGHSIGEYVAATLAGVFTLEDALTLVVEQGQMMESLPMSAMLAISLPEQDVQLFLNEHLSLAAINAPCNCLVSGSLEAIKALEKQLSTQEIPYLRLQISQGLHSPLIEPIMERFIQKIKQVDLKPPTIPYISNVTGNWIRVEQVTDPYYWVKHLRQTVRFSEGVQKLFSSVEQILLEIGPGRTLSNLIKRHPDKDPKQILLTSVRHPQEQYSDIAFTLNTLGHLWLAGVAIDWAKFYTHQQCYRIPLPTYPYERQRYWVDPPQNTDQKIEETSPQLHAQQTLGRSYLADNNQVKQVEQVITNIWKQVLGVEQIGINDDFFMLGGDSLVAVRVMAQIKNKFQVELPSAILLQNPTIAELSQQLKPSDNSTINALNSVLVPIQLKGEQIPLFCVHPVGGNVLCYSALSQRLGQEHPIYGLQSLGLMEQQLPLTTIEAMASHYLEEILMVQARGPYHLIGWSMGGMISYEMAQQLVHRGEEVALLVLIDSYIPTAENIVGKEQLLMHFIKDLAGQIGQRLHSVLELQEEKLVSLEQLFQLTQQYQFFPSELSLEELQRLWRVFEANALALTQYNPQPYKGTVLSLLASESVAQVPDTVNNSGDKIRWDTLVKGELIVHIINGDHYTLMREPNQIAQVAHYLQLAIAS